MVKPERIYFPKNNKSARGNVIYWMSRDQRSLDNWGLIYAWELSKKLESELAVVFTLANQFLDATERQYSFMIHGLKEVEYDLQRKNIPFYLLTGDPVQNILSFTKTNSVKIIVYDFDPLKIKQKWQKEIAGSTSAVLHEVDSHNIVPARFVSDKKEFGAYTLRPKINKYLEDFLDPFPIIEKQKDLKSFKLQSTNWSKALKTLKINTDVKPVNWITPGQKASRLQFEKFISDTLDNYDQLRNDPTRNAISNLSPYLHFGQISSQRIAIELLKNHETNKNTASFLEELIVRKELSDNYCLYNQDYDNLSKIPDWAKKTLNDHRNDSREYVYSVDKFENAETHEDLWNAAQNEMRVNGKMHGYMRMYWAKKILEWSESPEDALKTAIYLNDKYELDGRDPNGYAGCAWAIAGVHDRAWKERPVYGKIRYMNYNGAKRKFDVKSYISKWNSPSLF